jgi:hypothetical protein
MLSGNGVSAAAAHSRCRSQHTASHAITRPLPDEHECRSRPEGSQVARSTRAPAAAGAGPIESRRLPRSPRIPRLSPVGSRMPVPAWMQGWPIGGADGQALLLHA